MPELIWKGKYDEKGDPRAVDRTILPFQTVETVNESKTDRQANLLFRRQGEPPEGWRNLLIWGDNKIIMSSLLPRFAGKINLIYIDPPFATGQDFSFRVRVGDEEFVKEPSIIEEKAYRDTWGRGLDSYLQMMYERLVLMRELMAEDGSIFVHADYRICAYMRTLLEEVFGADKFRNEVIWKSQSPSGRKVFAKQLPFCHENLLWYSKTEAFRYVAQYRPYDEQYVRTRFRNRDERGPYKDYEIEGFGDEKIAQLKAEGRVIVTPTGKLRLKQYLHESQGVMVDSVWTDIPGVNSQAHEDTRYATQKPERLLERIVAMTSQQGDFVADFFCGSGTTLAVAEKLKRRWIGCDLSKWAIQVTRKRLLQITDCKPFEILNLGNYERHKLAANGLEAWERYVRFILELYRAEPIEGFATLHGKKGRASVHVGSVDSPVTMREIRQTLQEAKQSGVREVHFLGWDFEMGLHDLVADVGEDFGIKPRLVSIPKEALEVTDPAREEVRFFDLNYLELEQEVKSKTATVRLKEFIIANPEYLPDEVREKISKFTDYIDYWAVDWDYKDDTFHNQWQSFRTRKEPKLETAASFSYDKKGSYQVLVKVVDIFGNDTNKLLEVDIS